MKRLMKGLMQVACALLAPLAVAHEGHGVVGTVGHDLQHQAWTFAALVVTGALLLAGDRVLATLRARTRTRNKRDQ